MTLISVAIPTFNRIDYLEQALSSVENQRSSAIPLDIVVVDNCSEAPGMVALLTKIERRGIRVVRSDKNVGAIGNWNRCIQEAGGEWVHILHDDDYVEDGFYRIAQALLLEHAHNQLAMLVFGARVVDGAGRLGAVVPAHCQSGLVVDFPRYQACANLVSNPAVIFRRSLGLTIGGFGGKFPPYLSDWAFWFSVAKLGSVYVAPENLARYRIHAASGTLNDNVFSIRDCATFVDQQVASIVGTVIGDREKYKYTAGFGRHLVGLYRKNGMLREAFRLARQTVVLDPTLNNIARVVKKLLVP